MLEWIRKFNLRKAGYCSITVGVINVILHILVIVSVLPYTWVNGGRTESFSQAQSISANSIIMTIINILIAALASQIIPVKFNRFWGIAISVFLIVTLPFGVIGIAEQFLGTIFEKCFTSILTIVGFCSDVRIAFEKRW